MEHINEKLNELFEVLTPEQVTSYALPLFSTNVSAGFPSPADDYADVKLDLNQYLIKHPSATFFLRVKGNSMIDAGIHEGDLLIVDRSVTAANNKVIIGVLNGDFTVKTMEKRGEQLFLTPANKEYKRIEVQPGMDFKIWGVVTYVIHKL
jgi:DNA polymerase V